MDLAYIDFGYISKPKTTDILTINIDLIVNQNINITQD